MQKKKTTWILACDAGRAQLFEELEPGRAYSPVAAFLHPEGRAHVVDLVSDTNGRKPVGVSRGVGVVRGWQGGVQGRPGAAPDTDPKEVEAEKFARDLAAVLQKGLDDHRYQALVLVAPPHFLGLLRETVGDQVTKHLEWTLDKDLSLLSMAEIEKRVRGERAA